MSRDKQKSGQSANAELRRQAEERLRSQASSGESPRTETETQHLLHELQVHQIELEMQNTELRRARDELEVARDRYSELYDFAPIGYLCFDAAGLIRKINLKGSKLLGTERQQLVNRPFADFIADPGERKVFADHLNLVLQRRTLLKCAITLTRPDGSAINGHFQSIVITSGNMAGEIFSCLMDDTSRTRLETELQHAHDDLESIVRERTAELTEANAHLTREVEQHRQAEASLQKAYADIEQLKDRLAAENVYLQEEVAKTHNFGEFIGQSSAVAYVFFRIEQVAPQDATVLLLGETGTGKGMVARAIHSKSLRNSRPMVTVNCTSLPANLIESELFGREKGAFTGAHARQIGRFELADDGTIFLDEIGEMPLDLQSKLLRVLQDGEFERLGSPRTTKVNVRIIAASNRNLQEEVHAGRFREDLFYRLSVFPITIPPLRQRQEDIPLLVNHFIAKFNKKTGKQVVRMPAEALAAMEKYHWPGNVRELESMIERAVITSPGPTLQILDRFDTFRKAASPAGEEVKPLADLERDHILQVLQTTGWRIEGPQGAAKLLALNPSTLRARMRKFGLRRQ